MYRRTVVQRLMDAALDFQEALFDAQSQGGTTRQKHLREADAALNKLRLSPAAGPSLALAERRTIPARQRDGGGAGPVAGRVDEKS